MEQTGAAARESGKAPDLERFHQIPRQRIPTPARLAFRLLLGLALSRDVESESIEALKQKVERTRSATPRAPALGPDSEIESTLYIPGSCRVQSRRIS